MNRNFSLAMPTTTRFSWKWDFFSPIIKFAKIKNIAFLYLIGFVFWFCSLHSLRISRQTKLKLINQLIERSDRAPALIEKCQPDKNEKVYLWQSITCC